MQTQLLSPAKPRATRNTTADAKPIVCACSQRTSMSVAVGACSTARRHQRVGRRRAHNTRTRDKGDGSTREGMKGGRRFRRDAKPEVRAVDGDAVSARRGTVPRLHVRDARSGVAESTGWLAATRVRACLPGDVDGHGQVFAGSWGCRDE